MRSFKQQVEQVLCSEKGRRVLDEAARLARDPLARQRIEDLRRQLGQATSRQRPPR
ncbi:MAG TPA: hypothetical protein VD931_19315 [Baekduia sp.]|nr:hypothetical protein [Baekduia sp.]